MPLRELFQSNRTAQCRINFDLRRFEQAEGYKQIHFVIVDNQNFGVGGNERRLIFL